MKKSIIISMSVIAVIFMATLLNSCGKKTSTTDPMNSATVTLAYTPNPIIKNAPVTFTFTVMDGMSMMSDVTDYTCTTKMMMSGSTSSLTLARMDKGTYTGTCTFTDSDSVMVSFKFMYSGSMMMKDFNCVVK